LDINHVPAPAEVERDPVGAPPSKVAAPRSDAKQKKEKK